MSATDHPVVELRQATVVMGTRTLFSDLSLLLGSGEFLAVLGPNGVGKTTLLKVLLGLVPLASGQVTVNGTPPQRGNPRLGYVPQQQAFDRNLPIRARDLVRFGIDGHKWGLPAGAKRHRQRLNEVMEAVGASSLCRRARSACSREASSNASASPRLSWAIPPSCCATNRCWRWTWPASSAVTRLIDERRRSAGTPVVFVTHEVNPVLPYVDRILYLVRGRWAIGTPSRDPHQ
jgi:zinc/manganese transport system ATP-binding protein